MSYAEEAEKELTHLIAKDHASTFRRLDKNNQGENFVIKYLNMAEEPTSPKQIADELNLSSARVAVVLGKLEKKKLISRKMDDTDRRRINVTLTEKGKEAAAHREKEMREKIVKIFHMMGEEDTAQFITLTKKFVGYSRQLIEAEEGEAN